MRTTFHRGIKINYTLEFNTVKLELYISKRIGQKVLATFDDRDLDVNSSETNCCYLCIWVSTKKYPSIGVLIRDCIDNRLSIKKCINMQSRRCSYELLRALK